MNTLGLAVFLALAALMSHADAAIGDWLKQTFSKKAVDYGSWYCGNCAIASVGSLTTLPVDLQTFIVTNNTEIHDSKNEEVHRWIANSTITICDDTHCITLFYPSATRNWLPKSAPVKRLPGQSVRVPKMQPQSGGGRIEVAPVGPTVPDFMTGTWSLRVPIMSPTSPPRYVVPSVTVIFNGESITYYGPAYLLPYELNQDIGDYLDWDMWSGGLDGSPFCALCSVP